MKQTDKVPLTVASEICVQENGSLRMKSALSKVIYNSTKILTASFNYWAEKQKVLNTCWVVQAVTQQWQQHKML